MVKEPEVVTYYTLEEARKLIRREDVRKRNLLLRRLTQKGVGVAIIVATILTKEIAAIVFCHDVGSVSDLYKREMDVGIIFA